MLKKVETWIALLASLVTIVGFLGQYIQIPRALSGQLKYVGIYLVGLITGLWLRSFTPIARSRTAARPLRNVMTGVLVVSALALVLLVACSVAFAGTPRGEMAALWASRATFALVGCLVVTACL